ncbi:hypothetical protein [Sphingosinithalassobacter portus]|uniref:hypothetical protein n=1 Tax=Stakelama portus TaxID=2676234 RepID=UPI000D6E8866|nr:hypothetical protein [Sphingosinithalassobacter portus]
MFVALIRLILSYARSLAFILACAAAFFILQNLGRAEAGDWPVMAAVMGGALAIIAFLFFMPMLVGGRRVFKLRDTYVGDLVAPPPPGAAQLIFYADHRVHQGSPAVVKLGGIGEVALPQWSGTAVTVPPGRYEGQVRISGGGGGAHCFGFELLSGETRYFHVREQIGIVGLNARLFPVDDERSIARAHKAQAMLWRELAPEATGPVREALT